MNHLGPASIADLNFQIEWTSIVASHSDIYFGSNANLWRDLLSRRPYPELAGKQPGDRIRLELSPGELFQDGERQDIRRLKPEQFDPKRITDTPVQPRVGRFYPKGLLKDVAGVFSANMAPFRCLNVNNSLLTVDLGHPLAEQALTLEISVGAVQEKYKERGGSANDWPAIITQGVGMQAPMPDHPTDFQDKGAFRRSDETADDIFYQKPRLVNHLDDRALNRVQQLYGRFIQEDMRVLDLMSSWNSHLPADVCLKQVTGIGLNGEELSLNRALTDFHVQDLNKNPKLDLPSEHYEAAVCTVSVEYLVSPEKVYCEVARILRPGGYFVVTFSNRWFPPKAIGIWSRLHEFERMGLVLDYFQQCNRFTDLQTYSIRGLPRPEQDKYYRQFLYSDPVYAVWGRRKDK